MATRKTIVEATSQIIGQKEVDHLDRGPLDLTRRIDELEAEVSALKKGTIADLQRDNKALAKEVDDLLLQKKKLLDNRPSKWYNRTMKNIMIALLVLCFTATVGNTNENNIVNKITNHVNSEITKTKEYQTKVWADQKVKNAEMWSKLKSLFAKN